MSKKNLILSFLLGFFMAASPAIADMEAAKKWIDTEFSPSTLSKEQQLKEMEWFLNAVKSLPKDTSVKVVSETIATHEYESKVLAKAFTEITGMKVDHELTEEGIVVSKVQNQMKGASLYDAYINDSDLIGTHYRYGKVLPLSDFMAGDGKYVTLPTLDLDDFMGKSFCTAPDGKLYQLPDQQFANLYWFIVQIFQPSFYLLIPILLLISIILATAEQFKLYSSTVPVLKKTELALKLQAIINVTVILLVLLNQTSILFPTFTNRTAAKALVIGLQVLGLSLVSLNLKRAEQVKHNVDKHYLRFQTIEKYL